MRENSSLRARLKYPWWLWKATYVLLWLKHRQSRHETANRFDLDGRLPSRIAGVLSILTSLRSNCLIRSVSF